MAAPAAELEQLRLRDQAKEEQQAPPKSAPAPAPAPAPPPSRPPPRVRTFSERTPDGAAVLHYQLVDLGAQLYVWVGGGGAGAPTVSNLHFAIQQRAGSGAAAPAPPAVAALLPDGAAGRGEALSRRLAKRLGRPVLLSSAIPDAADPLLHALAEQRLLQELKDMGLLVVVKTMAQTPFLSDIVIYPIKSLRGISVPRVAVEPQGLAFDRRWMLVNDKNRFVTQREIPKLCLFQPELTPVDAPALGTRQASRLPGAALIVRPPPSSSLPPLRVPLEQSAAASSSSRTATVWGFSGDVLDEGDEAAAWFSAALAEMGVGGAGGAAPATTTAVRLVKHAPELPRGTRAVDPSFALPGTTTAFSDEYPVLAATEGSLADLNKRLGQTPALPMSRFRPNLVFAGGEASDAPWADDGWARVRVCSEQQGGVDFEYVKPCSRCKVTTVDPSTGEVGGGGEGEGGQKLPAGDHEPLRALRGFRTGAALGWDKKRPAFKHAVFFAWNVQAVVVEEGDGGDRVVALGAAGQQQDEKDDDGNATLPPPVAVLERGSRVEVVTRRKWE